MFRGVSGLKWALGLFRRLSRNDHRRPRGEQAGDSLGRITHLTGGPKGTGRRRSASGAFAWPSAKPRPEAVQSFDYVPMSIPSFCSSSSWMMIRGVTIIIKL